MPFHCRQEPCLLLHYSRLLFRTSGLRNGSIADATTTWETESDRIPARKGGADSRRRKKVVRMDSLRSQSQGKAPVFKWNDELMRIFVDIVVSHQVRYGKKQPYKWKDIALEFESKTEKMCTKETMRNKLESMKREYKAWNVLKNSETGLGWNPITGKIDATDEWWERKIKEDVHCKKYRSRGMDPAYEELLIRLFEGQVATGRLAFSPSMDPSQLSQPSPVTEPVAADAHSGADGLGGDDFFSRFMGAVNNEPPVVPPATAPGPSQQPSSQPRQSAPKRRRRQSVGSSRFEEHLVQSRTNSDRLVSLFEDEISSQDPPLGVQLREVMETLTDMIAGGYIQDGSDLWCFAVTICADKNFRELFLSMSTNERRVNWLNFEMRRRNSLGLP